MQDLSNELETKIKEFELQYTERKKKYDDQIDQEISKFKSLQDAKKHILIIVDESGSITSSWPKLTEIL